MPANWQHPKNEKGDYVPLFDNQGHFVRRDAEWSEEFAMWQKGLCRSDTAGEEWEPIPEPYRHLRYADYAGPRPCPDDYMPDWPDELRTHLMMYENTSEGTPLSPAFATPEELARWLADHGASAFAGRTADYEHWLQVCRGQPAVSLVHGTSGLRSGVEALGPERTEDGGS